MFNKFFNALTLSFFLTAVCVGVAIWATPDGFAGSSVTSNAKCTAGGTVYSTGLKKCSSFGVDDCSGSNGYRNRDDNYDCENATGKECEIYWKSTAYKNTVYPCSWKNGACKEGTGKTSGGHVNSGCNTSDM